MNKDQRIKKYMKLVLLAVQETKQKIETDSVSRGHSFECVRVLSAELFNIPVRVFDNSFQFYASLSNISFLINKDSYEAWKEDSFHDCVLGEMAQVKGKEVMSKLVMLKRLFRSYETSILNINRVSEKEKREQSMAEQMLKILTEIEHILLESILICPKETIEKGIVNENRDSSSTMGIAYCH